MWGCCTRAQIEVSATLVSKAGAGLRQCNRSHFRSAANFTKDNAEENDTTGDGTASYKIRTGPFRPLPLPPILDPVKLAAKERHKKPKARFPEHGWTPFQKQLRQNPYAHALASPVRACGITGARLPAFFLIDFQIIEHPETKKLWVLPMSTATTQAKAPSDEGQDKIAPDVPHLAVGRAEHILARRSVLRFAATKSRWHKIISQGTKEKLKVKEESLMWRPDMEDFVLSMLRHAAVTKLKWLFDHPGAGHVIKLDSPVQNIGASDDISCVLVNATFEPDIARNVQAVLEQTQKEIDSVSRQLAKIPGLKAVAQSFPPTNQTIMTTTYAARHVPVYSLHDLFGSAHSKNLLESSHFSKCLTLVVRSSPQTLGALMALMKLQFYLAED